MENKEHSKEIISHLNELVEINNDRIEGYNTALQETQESDLKALFKNLATHSQNFKIELVNEVRSLGGEPATGTRTSGKLYRAWMDIKSALSGKDRKAILSSCEYGENIALETYRDVLEKGKLPPTVNYMVMKQKDLLQQDHDSVKRLRDSAKGIGGGM